MGTVQRGMLRCPDLGGVCFSEVYISSTVVSIRSLVFVRFSEVVRFSEGPL